MLPTAVVQVSNYNGGKAMPHETSLQLKAYQHALFLLWSAPNTHHFPTILAESVVPNPFYSVSYTFPTQVSRVQ